MKLKRAESSGVYPDTLVRQFPRARKGNESSPYVMQVISKVTPDCVAQILATA